MTEKRSIAFVCHPYHRGGVTRWMADAAVAAAEEGYEVYFVTVAPVKEFFSSGGRETMLQLLGPYSKAIRIISHPVNFSFEFGTEAYRANVYSKLISGHLPPGVPLVIADDMAVWSGTCALADKYPVIGVLHGDQDYYYDRAKRYHKQLSICVCVSDRIRRNLMERCPQVAPTKVVIIPCGIQLPTFSPQTANDNVLRLAFIGRLTDYEKRAEDLVLICAELQREKVAFHLSIAGNSAESAITFKKSFEANGVGDFVTFRGWQDKAAVQQLLDSSDILLLTSNSEGMPLVMMEALASGCGFTGTRVSGIEDYEHDTRAKNCLSVYTVGDIADAVKKIRQVAAIPAHERQHGARKLAESEFSMGVCLKRYFAAIDGLETAIITSLPVPQSLSKVVYSKLIALARFAKMSMRKG